MKETTKETTKRKRSGYVVQCIKGNNNLFGFGWRHKKNQYIALYGKGTYYNTEAMIYDTQKDGPFVDEPSTLWKKYYKIIPVTVITTIEVATTTKVTKRKP